MNAKEPVKIEFRLSQAVKLRAGLEAKRLEYWERIIGPGGHHDDSWTGEDLVTRFANSDDFRLCYLKLVIISTLLIACDEYERSGKPLDDTLPAKSISYDLASVFPTRVNQDEFAIACEVIQDYLEIRRPLSETQGIPH